MMIESLLDCIIPDQESPKKQSEVKEKPLVQMPKQKATVKYEKFALGTPGSVLGIHSLNAYSQKPRNREERIEMKINRLNIAKSNSDDSFKKPVGRNKEAAPNSIKKSKAVQEKKTSNKVKKVADKVKKNSSKATPTKKIRGINLYRFVETARTLRSQVQKVVEQSPRPKSQTVPKHEPKSILARSKRISK